MHITNEKPKFDVPVLLLIYNRPGYTQKVFDLIKNVSPSTLYIAADGPAGNADKVLCENARKIADSINWECEVHKLYREKNLGCREAVYTALNWFFSRVEEGIVLEDDTVPSMNFFYFCRELLNRYRDKPEVMMVSGTSYFFNKIQAVNDYYFSSFASVWGWASWRRAWQKMEMQHSNIDKKIIQERIKQPVFSEYAYETIKAAVNGSLNTWDAQWAYTILKNRGLVARPFQNLIQNIGETGTHIKSGTESGAEKSLLFEMPYGDVNPNALKHPEEVLLSIKYDNLTFESIVNLAGLKHKRRGIFRELAGKAKRYIKSKVNG